MNGFEKFLALLDGRMTRPTLYGWYHLLCFAIVIAISVLLCVFLRKKSNKTTRIILLICSLVMIGFEIYKQLNFSMDSATGEWDYQWYAFPLQFCSTPMYVALLAACLPEGKIQNALYSFLATFGLFAGLVVFIYPGDVFTNTIGINIQTMVHHGLMIVMGIYLIASKRVDVRIKTLWKTVIKGLIVFSIWVVIALIADVIYAKTGGSETFNMFYISPYFPCTLPILSMIYPAVPYAVFLMIYLIGFAAAAFVIALLGCGIQKLCEVIKTAIDKRKAPQTVGAGKEEEKKPTRPKKE